MIRQNPDMAVDAIIRDLQEIVGKHHVLTGEDVSQRSDNWLPHHAMEARCIVRPATTAEVSAVAAYCNSSGIAIVPQGGRTGLAGGAWTNAGDVALSLERMTTISMVDPFGMTMEVEAGAPLQAVQEAAAEAGFLYPVDLGARGSATIGGTIATNAGGNSVLRYGMTREQILGLEVVLADGTVLTSMNRLIKNNAAYDLKHMFVGSEGTLGIITRAVLRLRPSGGQRATAFVGLSSFQAVLNLLAIANRRTSGSLTSYEVMWPSFIEKVVSGGRHRSPLTDRHNFYVLIEIVAQDADECTEQVVAQGWEAGEIEDAVIAQNGAQAAAFWALRDDIEALISGLPSVLLYDISLPQTDMAVYVCNLEAALACVSTDMTLAVFGHVADGNLHLIIGKGTGLHHQVIDQLVYPALAAVGGSISAEHGIGLEKKSYLHHSRTDAELRTMACLKAALDPRSTLNPGKVLPDQKEVDLDLTFESDARANTQAQ